MFQRWESQQPIDIPALRKLVIPLLERLDEVGSEVFTCYKYASKEDYFYHHSVAVGMLATYLSQIIGYKQGESLQLSNNSRGEIVFIDDDEPTRPMVKLKDSGEIISLQDHPTLHIEDVFND